MDFDPDSRTASPEDTEGRKRTRHHNMKLEVLGPADFNVDPGLCDREPCRALARNVESRPIASTHRPPNQCVYALAPHSLASEKAWQRDRLLAMIERLLRNRPRVNVYVFDDWLLRPADCPPPPSTPATVGSGTLVSAEILTRFGSDRVTVWAPNLKPAVVAALRELSTATTPPGRNQPCVMTGVGCYCAFNHRWREHLHAAGGIDVLSADCFGAFSTGVTQLVRDMTRDRLFHLHRDVCNGEPAALVAWAVSDLPGRMQDGLTPSQCAVCHDELPSLESAILFLSHRLRC
jgi:hypothetical protein